MDVDRPSGVVGIVGSENLVDESQLVGVQFPVNGAAAPVVHAGEQLPVASLPSFGMNSVGSVGQVMEKRKRGRPSRGLAPNLPPPKRIKEEEEDVCFICFDGGHLVLCDRKGCPKAYHASCIKRDEAFFRSKSKWNCGWHICSVCLKAAHYMCYTCTYSLCKACTKSSEYVRVRGNYGFCPTCMKTIMLVENEDASNNEMIKVDFDDQTSWEYLFKVYWVMLRNKKSLTLNELKQAQNPERGVTGSDLKLQSLQTSPEAAATLKLMRSCENSDLKAVKEQVPVSDQNLHSTDNLSGNKSTTLSVPTEWASRELLEFVAHVKNGDTTVLSQFDVQTLLLEYVKTNNLQDPRRKSQIVCDVRLRNLFGKPLVGHFEMLKLLEYHFPNKEDNQNKASIPAGVVGSLANHSGAPRHKSTVLNHNKRRKTRSQGEEKIPQTNLDDYAAINVHNINLIFLRRSLIESLLAEVEKFHDKVLGSFVRIRVSSDDLKHDMYRLVQVVGITKAAEPYRVGDKMSDVMLEVLNLNKKESMSIDAISDQDFSEDECRRLCQSIKFGLVNRLTVGEIQARAIACQALKLDNVIAAEMLQLNHLRDQASTEGRKKEFRECNRKIQSLKTPRERQRRLSKIPEVHADPKMHPDYESEDDAADGMATQRSSLHINGNQLVHPKIGVNEDEPTAAERLQEQRDGSQSNSSVKPETRVDASASLSVLVNQSVLRTHSETATPAFQTGDSPSINASDMEKIWRYHDPNRKIQGPFSMAQLRQWSTTGYFPADMKIWNDKEQDNSILLSDALNGRFNITSQLVHNTSVQEGGNGVDNKEHGLCSETGSAAGEDEGSKYTNSTVQLNSSHKFDRPETEGRTDVCQSSQEKREPVSLNLDLNDKDISTASVSNPSKAYGLKGDSDLLDQPCTRNMEGQCSEHQESTVLEVREAEMLPSISMDIHSNDNRISDLPHPTPNSVDGNQPRSPSKPTGKEVLPNLACKPSDVCQGGQGVTEQPVPSTIPFEYSRWSSVPGQGDVRVGTQRIADEWIGCSIPPAKPCSREWESGAVAMSSLKHHEIGGDFSAPNSHQNPHTVSHPAPNMSSWLTLNEPIMFSTLAEESVSDLLAEVDAMESQSGLASPTSAARCMDDMMDRNDCFSSIEDLSPGHDAGNSDALSAPADNKFFPSLAAVMDDLFGTPDADAFDPLKISGGHSTTSSEGETKSADAPMPPWEVGPDRNPPCAINQARASANMGRGRGLETVDPGWATGQGNMNMGWVGPPQAFAHVGWGPPSLGTSWMDPNFNNGAYNGNIGWSCSPRGRYGGSRDWPPLQVGDMGFDRGRPPWSRQPNGGSGGYSRPPSKGQRVCKFYESGHCKKGASCDYLHP